MPTRAARACSSSVRKSGVALAPARPPPLNNHAGEILAVNAAAVLVAALDRLAHYFAAAQIALELSRWTPADTIHAVEANLIPLNRDHSGALHDRHAAKGRRAEGHSRARPSVISASVRLRGHAGSAHTGRLIGGSVHSVIST
jgi:hypothetical protein